MSISDNIQLFWHSSDELHLALIQHSKFGSEPTISQFEATDSQLTSWMLLEISQEPDKGY